MKQFILIAIAVVALFSLESCFSDFECYRGNGKDGTLEVSLDEFSELESNSSIDIVLVPDSFNGAVITGDDNIIDLVELRILGKKMIVDYANVDCVKPSQKTTVELHFGEELKAITVDGSGEIVSKAELNGDVLEIFIDGSGDVFLEANYDDLLVDIDGSGNVEVEGTGNSGYVLIDGSGDVDLFDYDVATMGVEVDGSGDTRVSVSEEISVWINGSGDVLYRGDADLIIQERNGSGEVRKL